MSEKEYLPGQMDFLDDSSDLNDKLHASKKAVVEAAEYIEDAEDEAPALIDSDKVLTNDELEDGGLVPVRSFMRTRASKSALRVRKSRQKAEAGETGPKRKQLNLQAPTEPAAREVLKDVSAALLNQQISKEDLTAVLQKQDHDWMKRALTAEAELKQIKNRAWWRFW
jgi:hypothetical protein